MAMLWARAGSDSEVRLRDGRCLLVRNIAWGYDDDDDWAHVTSNISPEVQGLPVDTFSTADVVAVNDPATGIRIYSRP